MFTILDTNICLQANLSFGLQMASIIGLYLTIITHLVFSELRNLPGLNLLAMNTNMVLYQQLFLGTIHILRKQDLGLFLTVSLHEHDSCTDSKVENILKGSLDSIPSPSPSVKIQKKHNYFKKQKTSEQAQK